MCFEVYVSIAENRTKRKTAKMQRALAEASTTQCDEGSNPVEYSESLAPSVFSRQSYARIKTRYTVWRMCSCAFCVFLQTSRGRWKKKKSQDNKKTTTNSTNKRRAQRPAQSGVHIAQHTLAAGRIPAACIQQYISAPSVGCGILTALSVASKPYANRWNLNEVTTPARKN